MGRKRVEKNGTTKVESGHDLWLKRRRGGRPAGVRMALEMRIKRAISRGQRTVMLEDNDVAQVAAMFDTLGKDRAVAENRRLRSVMRMVRQMMEDEVGTERTED